MRSATFLRSTRVSCLVLDALTRTAKFRAFGRGVGILFRIRVSMSANCLLTIDLSGGIQRLCSLQNRLRLATEATLAVALRCGIDVLHRARMALRTGGISLRLLLDPCRQGALFLESAQDFLSALSFLFLLNGVDLLLLGRGSRSPFLLQRRLSSRLRFQGSPCFLAPLTFSALFCIAPLVLGTPLAPGCTGKYPLIRRLLFAGWRWHKRMERDSPVLRRRQHDDVVGIAANPVSTPVVALAAGRDGAAKMLPDQSINHFQLSLKAYLGVVPLTAAPGPFPTACLQPIGLANDQPSQHLLNRIAHTNIFVNSWRTSFATYS